MNKDTKLSIIWLLENDDQKNQKTLDALTAQGIAEDWLQLVICPKQAGDYIDKLYNNICSVCHKVLLSEVCENPAVALNNTKKHIEGQFVLVMESGDFFTSEKFLEEMLVELEQRQQKLGMVCRYFAGRKERDVMSSPSAKGTRVIDFHKNCKVFPYTLNGVFISADIWKKYLLDENLPYVYGKKYMIEIVLDNKEAVYCGSLRYEFANATERFPAFFQPLYEREWYYDILRKMWKNLLEGFEGKVIPKFVQYQLVAALYLIIAENLNNKNKHCVEPLEAYDYLWSWNDLLKYIDDDVILNRQRIGYIIQPFYIYRLLLAIKYKDENFKYEKYYLKGKEYFGYDSVLVDALENQKINIQYMEYRDDRIYIDGTISGIYDLDSGRLIACCNDEEYEPSYNERYSHTKLFGVSFYKRRAFRFEIPLKDVTIQSIQFVYRDDCDERVVDMTFESHTSMLSKAFKNSYWRVNENHIAKYRNKKIDFYMVTQKQVVRQEMRLWKEMRKGSKKQRKYMLFRMGYFALKPFLARKPIWMYIDKIYKAGDSSEYLFKYACGQKDGKKHYYLIDKDCSDYKRLKKEGYGRHLIKRKSIKHRLMFLYADKMIISNSTVFAFNDYKIETSAYIRDLVYFDVCCVQHGMSVQQIAIAQNRLRDNTKLYFCASKYELDNLNKPVYDYAGYDALKLTGVPRYDGLINDDKRQILIAPTWRMQAAAQVTENEGVQRKYNPLFKSTTYFKVFNSLINDERLLQAAQKYNYRIHYVLHPIVSIQKDDFDTNDVVDIISSVGDMSYEKEFRESSLMVSDYSGVQYDFAYMRKPVVYLHHDEIPQHYERGTFDYDTMAFGEICHSNDDLIDVLIEYMKHDCRMKPEYIKRADDFFYYDDHSNCERIYNTIIEYDKENAGVFKRNRHLGKGV